MFPVSRAVERLAPGQSVYISFKACVLFCNTVRKYLAADWLGTFKKISLYIVQVFSWLFFFFFLNDIDQLKIFKWFSEENANSLKWNLSVESHFL